MRWTRLSLAPHVLISLLLGFSFLPTGPSAANAASATWTVMVYMADDFTSSLNWQDDLNEMEAAQQSSLTNIIALVDPYGPNNSEILKIVHDPNYLDSTIVSTRIDDGGAVISGGEVDMASPSTLSAFIEFAAANYSAQHYALILWGHGAGWVGLCPDGIDLLTLPELRSALSVATNAIGRSLDMIVIDSCAEATVEMLYQIREYAELFVGSEKDVPFQGLPYMLVMNDLAAEPAQDPDEFGTRIVDDYVAWSKTNSEYSVTLGVFNLTKVDLLVGALNLFSVQGQKYDPIFHEVLKSALNASETYEEPYHVDFGGLMLSFQKSDLPLEMRYLAVETLLKYAQVIEHFAKYDNPDPTDGIHVSNASGLAIYPSSSDLRDIRYGDLSISSSSWYGFGRAIRNDTTVIPNGPGPTVLLNSSIANAVAQTSDLPSQPPIDTATLIWQSDYSQVQAWVFRNESGSLVYQEVIASTLSNQILIDNCTGSLTIAASAMSASYEAVSYRTLNLTLEGKSTVRVQILENGKLVEIDTKYEIRIATMGGAMVSGGFADPNRTDTFSITLAIPEDAQIGDLVTVEVNDRSTHALVGELKVFVPPVDTTVLIEVVSRSNVIESPLVPFLLAILPALLILAFAWMLHSQNRRNPPAVR